MAGHYGLLGMRERARLAGGALEVTSQPGAGTILHLCLPLRPPPPPALAGSQERPALTEEP